MNYFGRRIVLFGGCVIVIIASFVQCFAPNLGGESIIYPSLADYNSSIHGNFRSAFMAGRALVGVGQGFVLPCGPTFISETAPADIRGRIMSMWQGMLKSSTSLHIMTLILLV